MYTRQPNNSQQSPVHFDLVLIPSLLVLHPSALPVLFQEELLNKEATEGEAVTLRCKLSKSAPVEWRKGNRVLKPSAKYKIEQEGPFAELVIQDLDLADAGDYSCVCGDQQTAAALTVNGKNKFSTRASSITPKSSSFSPALSRPCTHSIPLMLINFSILFSFSLSPFT